jgi:hypothetical protein
VLRACPRQPPAAARRAPAHAPRAPACSCPRSSAKAPRVSLCGIRRRVSSTRQELQRRHPRAPRPGPGSIERPSSAFSRFAVGTVRDCFFVSTV